MSGFVDSFRNIFKIQELRQRIIFTVLLLIVVRIGAHITLPGIDAGLLAEATKNQADNTLFGLYDLFVGGAFSNAAIFALGIMPYISSSIIIQLLGAVVPYFQKLQKEGEAGRKKNYTDYQVRYSSGCFDAGMGCKCSAEKQKCSRCKYYFS